MGVPPKAFHVKRWFWGFEVCLYYFSVYLIYERQIAKRGKGAVSRLYPRNGDKILKILAVSMAVSELA